MRSGMEVEVVRISATVSAPLSSTQLDINQNQVRFGLQFGYPITFD